MTLATPRRQMPTDESVRELLANTLGRDVELVDRAEELDLDDEELDLRTVLYVDDDGRVAAALLSDVRLAAYGGAALAMVPKPVADEAIQAKQLGESLGENGRELANIGAGLLNGPSVPHVRLSDAEHGIPDAARDLIVRARGRKTWEITIADYGTGTVGLYAV